MTPIKLTSYKDAVGPGWQPILDELAKQIAALGFEAYVSQIKEKFGGLRISLGYPAEVQPLSEEACQLIIRAELAAATRCENCGALELRGPRQTKTRWLKTLCDACMETRNAKKSV